MTTRFGYRLREAQERLMGYSGGRVAISAVPGSGKTLTLALLAASLILDGKVGAEGEVLVVTVQNSAVDNISQRIRRILAEQKRPPIGYRVCTLHKLANDILRLRPDLAGVVDDYHIVDEADARRVMRQAAERVVAENADLWGSFLPTQGRADRSYLSARWMDETVKIGSEVSKLCKHWRLSPRQARERFGDRSVGAPFSWLGLEMYAAYQEHLGAQAGLDFDDLIWRAFDALEQDPAFVANLQSRWPYVLEDEVQDSSPLQEDVVRRLVGARGNWVRVGDPNQAINGTFTSADPRFFRRFLDEPGVQTLHLHESGRSGRPIVAAANALVEWACSVHPEPSVRASALAPQQIMPTSSEDAQQNPPDDECHIYVRATPFPSVDDEAGFVARAAARYIAEHPLHSVAILCPAGFQGAAVVESLQTIAGTPYEDLLNLTPQARNVARALAAACTYLGDPTVSRSLAALFITLQEDGPLMPLTAEHSKQVATLLRSIAPHELLFPRSPGSMSARLPRGVVAGDECLLALERFVALSARWVRAAALPIDQLLLTIGQDLYATGADDADLGSLAVCQTIAQSLRARARDWHGWRVSDYAQELQEIARNRRGLRELSLPDVAYLTKPGVIVVTTMHKAKGLEWDAVYLVCVDSLEFPETRRDAFRDEPAYMPGRAPVLEARLVLEGLLSGVEMPDAAACVEQGRLETIAERLRLLYVAVTRARRNISITSSSRNGGRSVRPAAALAALQPFASAPVTDRGISWG